MSNLHPGFILIATGFIAAIVPKSLRKYVLAGGPLVALAAMLSKLRLLLRLLYLLLR